MKDNKKISKITITEDSKIIDGSNEDDFPEIIEFKIGNKIRTYYKIK